MWRQALWLCCVIVSSAAAAQGEGQGERIVHPSLPAVRAGVPCDTRSPQAGGAGALRAAAGIQLPLPGPAFGKFAAAVPAGVYAWQPRPLEVGARRSHLWRQLWLQRHGGRTAAATNVPPGA